MNRFWLSQGAHTAWDSSAETPHTNCILKYFENMMIDHSDSTIF
jgi:hypothetical protein